MWQEYASCEWETPYGRTVSFSDNHREEVPVMSYHPPTIFCLPSFPNQSSQQITLPSLTLTVLQESGRLQYFGFSSMDCGIVIRDIGTRDSGGWTCRVSATVAGKHQVSADIVRLFVGNNNHSSKSFLLVNRLITRNITKCLSAGE